MEYIIGNSILEFILGSILVAIPLILLIAITVAVITCATKVPSGELPHTSTDDNQK